LCALAALAVAAPGSPGSIHPAGKPAPFSAKRTPGAPHGSGALAAKALRIVKTESRFAKCGCLGQPVCDCRDAKFQFVSPEIRRTPEADNICACLAMEDCPCRPKQLVEAMTPNKLVSNSACGCIGEQKCPCGSSSFVTRRFPAIKQTTYVSSDDCGCLNLEVCPCRQVQYQEPQMRPAPKDFSCGCLDQPECACRPTEHQAPEYRSPCKCEDPATSPCNCGSGLLPRN